ncbi:MAG: CAP domain-containing protein [Candidatus Moranbacteria bacterium]|nr:CAP domain-containing protein [Candidatus Moranbacteria bacterium]
MKRLIIIIFISLLLIPAGRVSAAGSSSPWVDQAVKLANGERKQRGIAELSVSNTLEKAAALKLTDMEKNGYFAHTSPQGLTPWFFMDKADYGYRYAGENLAIHFTDPKSEHIAWMNSEKHCQNVLDPRFREVGIAIKKTYFEGRETMLVVEMFGTRPGQEPQTSLTKEDALAMCRGELPSVSGVSEDRSGKNSDSSSGRIGLFSGMKLLDDSIIKEIIVTRESQYDIAQVVLMLVIAISQIFAVVLATRMLLTRESREGVYLS